MCNEPVIVYEVCYLLGTFTQAIATLTMET
jgi:hypothetical protein